MNDPTKLSELAGRCRLCWQPLATIHGQSVCLNDVCPLKLQPQGACCEGERAEYLDPPKKNQKEDGT